MSDIEPADFWEERYAGRSQVWSGRVNEALAAVASTLPAGRVLDLGCGEGGDAIWLAEHGWSVTAVDISTTAIERGRRAALERGLADRIAWVASDLGAWRTEARFDLVCSCFLHSPVALPRGEILRAAAQLVAPGGRLLIVSHAAAPPWASQLHGHHHRFPTPAEQLAELELDPGWLVHLAETRRRSATGPDGVPAELEDSIVLLQRPA
ncbi:MAG: class I SAM-dependent methyltransferase [Propionicimonas sp.]